MKPKILSIKEEIKKSRKVSSPYIIEFKKNKKRLICFGINHVSKGDFSSEQFKKFDKILKSIKKGIVLVEAPNNYIKNSRGNVLGELDYIIPKVKKKKLDIEGVDLNIFRGILRTEKRNYKEKILLRILFYLNRPDRREKIKENIDEIIKIIEKEEEYSNIYKKSKLNKKSILKALEKYLLRNNGKRIKEITKEDSIIPSPVEKKTPINKFIRKVSLERDRNMLSKLNIALKKYNNIFYILGRNHIIRQEPAIRDIFRKL
jgi:hypothetical protein